MSGSIHIWQTSSPDNWAAFAPGFEELEENAEYDEREDEFDIVSESIEQSLTSRRTRTKRNDAKTPHRISRSTSLPRRSIIPVVRTLHRMARRLKTLHRSRGSRNGPIETSAAIPGTACISALISNSPSRTQSR